MALVDCPDCKHKISSNAASCPACNSKSISKLKTCKECQTLDQFVGGTCSNCGNPDAYRSLQKTYEKVLKSKPVTGAVDLVIIVVGLGFLLMLGGTFILIIIELIDHFSDPNWRERESKPYKRYRPGRPQG